MCYQSRSVSGLFRKAISEYTAATINRDSKLWSKKREEASHWELSHSLFLLMGGFRVVVQDSRNNEQGRADPEAAAVQGASWAAATVEKPPWVGRVLYPQELLELRRYDHVRLPSLTAEEIHDKSKANVLVKALAVMQVLWVCVEILVRTSRRLPVSQLELAVAAYSVCTIATYIFYISKPKDVKVPASPIRIPKRTLPNSFKDLALDPHWCLMRVLFFGDTRRKEISGLSKGIDCAARKAVPNDAVYVSIEVQWLFLVGVTIGGSVFGAIHIAGWNLIFLTLTERLLWHIASGPAVLPPLYILIFKVVSRLSWKPSSILLLWFFILLDKGFSTSRRVCFSW